jgi:hypothetical protein
VDATERAGCWRFKRWRSHDPDNAATVVKEKKVIITG